LAPVLAGGVEGGGVIVAQPLISNIVASSKFLFKIKLNQLVKN
jgi:hypothetical protein